MEEALWHLILHETDNAELMVEPPIDGVTKIECDYGHVLYCWVNNYNYVKEPFCGLSHDTRLKLCEYVNEKLNK